MRSAALFSPLHVCRTDLSAVDDPFGGEVDISTGYVERQDLDRGPMLHVLQLRSPHQILRVTPAMEAGIADHVWSIEEW